VNEARCVICTEATAATMGLLCSGHYSRLSRMLRDVEDEAVHLDPRPSMQVQIGSGKGSLASERAPVRLDVLVHTDRRRGIGWAETEDDAHAAGSTLPILDVLGSWARMVREERDLGTPDSVTITGERDLLSRHLDWIAEQPWVDEAYGDLRTLLGQLKAANGTQDDKPVGRCYLPAETGTCNGPIWVDQAAGHAHCGRCRSAWDGPQLALLGFELDRARREAARPRADDGQPMLTADELVAKGHVTTAGNVRVRAHRLGVVSVDGHYDPRWFTDKASA
jgi:hypothetical protein